jgi:hypothetical protein
VATIDWRHCKRSGSGALGTIRTSAPSEVDNSRSCSNFGLMSLPPLPLSGIEICLRQKVSQKREFLRSKLEAFGNFSLKLLFSGDSDQAALREKPVNRRVFAGTVLTIYSERVAG